MSKNGGVIGVSDHGGWAVLVAVGPHGTLLDRRRVELVDEGLPKIPHHSECQRLPLDEAVEQVERVCASVDPSSPCLCKIFILMDLRKQGAQIPLRVGLRGKFLLTKELGDVLRGRTGALAGKWREARSRTGPIMGRSSC